MKGEGEGEGEGAGTNNGRWRGDAKKRLFHNLHSQVCFIFTYISYQSSDILSLVGDPDNSSIPDTSSPSSSKISGMKQPGPSSTLQKQHSCKKQQPELANSTTDIPPHVQNQNFTGSFGLGGNSSPAPAGSLNFIHINSSCMYISVP